MLQMNVFGRRGAGLPVEWGFAARGDKEGGVSDTQGYQFSLHVVDIALYVYFLCVFMLLFSLSCCHLVLLAIGTGVHCS